VALATAPTVGGDLGIITSHCLNLQALTRQRVTLDIPTSKGSIENDLGGLVEVAKTKAAARDPGMEAIETYGAHSRARSNGDQRRGSQHVRYPARPALPGWN
jgi:hypothetical protein